MAQHAEQAGVRALVIPRTPVSALNRKWVGSVEWGGHILIKLIIFYSCIRK